MRKHIQQVIACMVAVTAILVSVVGAHALVTATRRTSRLDFSGTTAQCYAYVVDSGKTITVTAKLWHGSTLVVSWTNTGTSFVEVYGQKAVQSGQTYTLKVSYIINGVTRYFPDITKTCP